MPAPKQLTRIFTIPAAIFFAASAIASENAPISIAGIVQDHVGKPVAEARIFVLDAKDEWTTKTDGRGAFTLQAMLVDGSFLFIERKGFRLHGEQLTKSDKPFDRQLTRITEPIDGRLVGKDWEIAPDERLKLLRRVFDPYLETMLSSDKDRDKLRPLELLAQIDPERTLEILDKKPFKQPRMSAFVRRKVVEQFARTDPEMAIEVAESFNGGNMQGFSFLRITQLAADLPRAVRVALLSRAAADAKSVTNPGERIVLLGLVAEALLDVGERVTAEKLFRETQVVAEKVANVAWAGYARGAFAEELAQIDVAAALPLVTGLADDSKRNRHLGNMAHELASINPAEAERVLNMIKRPVKSRRVIHERDSYAVRVCYRMAKKDLARAKKVADACVEKNQQAYAYGLIAHAIADEDREQATKLLRDAYELLRDGVRDPRTVKVQSSQIAGALLRTAEHVDPTLVRELIWRTISLRTPRDENEQYYLSGDRQTSLLVSWLSRYDRRTASTIVDQWHSGVDLLGGGRYQYLVALALVDPQRAVELAESQDKDGVPNPSRFAVARVLSTEGESRIRIPHREAGLWPIDMEELDGSPR